MTPTSAARLCLDISPASPALKSIPHIARREISFEVQPSSDYRPHDQLDITSIDPQTWFKLTPEIAGLMISTFVPLIPGLRLNSTLLGYGAWEDSLTASVNLQVLASEEAALLFARVLGLTLGQSQILVTDSSGTAVPALDVTFADGRPAGDLFAVAPLWSACRSASGGLLGGFTPRRWGNLDGFTTIDVSSSWPSPDQARRWIFAAAARVGARVTVRHRRVSTASVENDWAVRDPHGEGFLRLLVAAGRWDLALRAAEVAVEVRSTLTRAATHSPGTVATVNANREGRVRVPCARRRHAIRVTSRPSRKLGAIS